MLLINNLGAISDLEMGVIVKDTVEHLAKTYGVTPLRIFSGRYMTSLEMSGVQISILKIVTIRHSRQKIFCKRSKFPIFIGV